MSRDRKQTTGRYATREELIDTINSLYYGTDATITDVARIVKISGSTVSTVTVNWITDNVFVD